MPFYNTTVYNTIIYGMYCVKTKKKNHLNLWACREWIVQCEFSGRNDNWARVVFSELLFGRRVFQGRLRALAEITRLNRTIYAGGRARG